MTRSYAPTAKTGELGTLRTHPRLSFLLADRRDYCNRRPHAPVGN